MAEPSARRVEDLFDQAVDLDPSRQATFLNEQCAGDADLRAAVEELLQLDRGAHAAESLLRSPLAGSRPKTFAPPAPRFPAIDRYRVVRVLGEGGMGAVYEAEQDSPRRSVALKIVRPGLASPALLKRFSHEAQILARLHHPGIAQVYEAGLANDGQPFFAMEFIRGLPLDEYANRHGLDLAARVGLVARVCDAVQHAHDRGVIHRDLKPANILVEESGQPKVLDFGVARATDADLLTAAGLTRTGQLLGTPNYMSPEQVTGDPTAIDRRADVYALGVILFELLAHRLPYQLENRPLAEAARLILEQDPPRLGSLDPELRGDLETIVAKALEKDPARRYSSSADLAGDLRRWMAHQPILARRVSAAHRFGRWCKRNPVVAGQMAAVFLLLAVVAGVASVGYLQTKRALNVAEAAEATAKDEASRARTVEHEMRRQWYAASSNLMQPAWDNAQISRLRTLLAETEAYPDRGFEWYYWQRLCHLDQHTFMGHRSEVNSVCWSPDGTRLATGSTDGTVKVWDAAGDREPLTLHAHKREVFSVCWSPDGTRLATGSTDGTAKVWELAGDREPLTLRGHHRDVFSVSWSPDGARLATGSDDGTAKVWDAAGGPARFTLEGHTGRVNSVSWSPDGARMATGSFDGTAKVWDAAGGPARLTLTGHTGPVYAVSWSPDGARLATGSFDGTAKVWDAAGGPARLTLTGHTGLVYAVSWSPDGARLATGSYDGTAKVWNAVGGPARLTLTGHGDVIRCVSWSPDGARLATGSVDRTAKIWDAAGGREPLTFKGHRDAVRSVRWSPDGARLATGSHDGKAKVWDAAGGRELLTLTGHTGPVYAASWSPDGAQLATGSGDGTTKVWDAADGQDLVTLIGHTGTVYTASWSQDGMRLATGSADGKAKVWDAAGGHELLTLTGHTGPVYAASWSTDGARLATGSGDGTMKVWDVADGRHLVTLSGHTGRVNCVTWSPDGTRLATGSADGTARVWDPAGGHELLALTGHAGWVNSVSWSPDGTRLATGSADRTAKVWDAAGAAAVQQWTRQDRAVQDFLDSNNFRSPHAQGFLQTWLLLLPLPFAAGESGAQALVRQQLPGEAQLRPQPGEEVAIGGRQWVWQEHRSPRAVVNFNAVAGRVADRSVVYAACYIESDRARDGLWLQVGSDDQGKIYLNGRAVFEYRQIRDVSWLNLVGPLGLQRGVNVLLFKVANETGEWEGCMRLIDDAGRPVQGLRVKLTP